MKWNKIRVVYGNCQRWCIYLNRERESVPVIQLASGNFVEKKSLQNGSSAFFLTLTHVAIIVNEIWNGDLSNFSFPTVERLEIQNLRWTNWFSCTCKDSLSLCRLYSSNFLFIYFALVRSIFLHLFFLSRLLSNEMKIPQHVSIYTSHYMHPFGDRRERNRALNLLPLISKKKRKKENAHSHKQSDIAKEAQSWMMSTRKGRAVPQKQRRMIKMLATLSFMVASASPLESHQKQAVELPSPVVLCTTILSRLVIKFYLWKGKQWSLTCL